MLAAILFSAAIYCMYHVVVCASVFGSLSTLGSIKKRDEKAGHILVFSILCIITAFASGVAL